MQNSRKKRKGYPICLDWITPGCEFKRCPCWCNECRGEMCQLRFLQAHLQEHGLFHFASESAVIPPAIRQIMESLQTPSPEVDCSEAALAHDFIHVSESESDDDVPGNIDKCEDQEFSDEEEELQHFEYDAECQRLILDCNEGQDEEQVSKAALGESSRSFMKGSKRSVFSIALAFLDAQVATGISNRSMSVFLRLFTKVLSELDENTCFPKSTEEIHKIVEKAAPSTRYIAIHACYNDCKLFEVELENAVNCPDCGAARYKRDSRTPRKVFRRFPLIPALQQKARCPEFAKRMSWCCNNSSIDGIMRGPIDGQLFQKFLQQYPEFSTNTLFFSLFGDGVSPTRSRNSKPKTCWPFGLICLNLPPDEGIQASNIHLAFIAPGPKQVKKVDTYLRPLVEELKLLKEGVEINGTLWKAVLMYTTHDYPGFSVCSGLKTSGYYPCPACGPQFRGEQSQVLNKIVYVGHRQFLEQDDPLRRTKLANFNGEIETRPKPVRLGPNEWLKKWEENPQCEGMKRLSIFYELDYFGSLEVRFTLDFMHILKNVAEQIWRYIMGGKLLHFDMSRIKKDLENGNSKPELWDETKRAPWLATSEERRTIMQRIAKFRVPTSYCAASLQFCGEEGKLEGLTSHDYLHLIRDILPIVLTGT